MVRRFTWLRLHDCPCLASITTRKFSRHVQVNSLSQHECCSDDRGDAADGYRYRLQNLHPGKSSGVAFWIFLDGALTFRCVIGVVLHVT